ncbi:MAG: twin-arginine translocation signal domain-containing protein, partial [Pirellulales bacterium]
MAATRRDVIKGTAVAAAAFA